MGKIGMFSRLGIKLGWRGVKKKAPAAVNTWGPVLSTVFMAITMIMVLSGNRDAAEAIAEVVNLTVGQDGIMEVGALFTCVMGLWGAGRKVASAVRRQRGLPPLSRPVIEIEEAHEFFMATYDMEPMRTFEERRKNALNKALVYQKHYKKALGHVPENQADAIAKKRTHHEIANRK